MLNFKDKTSSVCCQNQSIYTEYLGDDCGRFIENSNSDCSFTESFAVNPCSKTNFQDVSRFCKVSNVSCVVKNHFITGCGKLTPYNECDVEHIDCRKINP